jgi:hypothetical protein
MSTNDVKKKVREAAFFLSKIQEQSRVAFGDHEPFDYYLSAFLSAARSVDYRLRHGHGTKYTAFRENIWNPRLALSEQRLLKFMTDDRNLEVHEAGSGRVQGEVRIPIRGRYEDGSGSSITAFGPPGVPPAEVIKPTYTFDLDGHHAPVVESCSEYLRLLERLVEEFARYIGSA